MTWVFEPRLGVNSTTLSVVKKRYNHPEDSEERGKKAVFTVKNTNKTVSNGEMYTVTTVRSLIFNPCSVTKGR